jgi:cobalt/nickel transport system permease protein
MTLARSEPQISGSFLAARDARFKVGAFVAFGFAVAMLQGVWPSLAAFGVVLVVALFAAKISLPLVMSRLLLLTLSVAPLVVLLPLVNRVNGWLLAATILLRLLTLGVMALMLIRTTKMPTLCHAAQKMGVPNAFVQITLMAYQYTSLIAAEVRRMRVALVCRGFRVRSDVTTYRTLGYSVGSLVVRSADRAERVSEAMRARGFDGSFHTTQVFTRNAGDFVLLYGAISVALVLLAWDIGSRFAWLG